MKLPENVVPMPAERRAELKRLAQAATPGPWAYGSFEFDDWGYIRSTEETSYGYGPLVALGRCGGTGSDKSIEQHREDGTDPYGPNAAYIAAVSPDITLATLAYVEALEAQLAAAETSAAELLARATRAEQKAQGLLVELAEQEREKLELVKENEKLSTVRDKLAGVFGQLLFVGPNKDPVELQMQVRYELAQIVYSVGLKPLPTGHTYPSYIIDQYNQFNPGSPVLGKVALAPPASAPVAPVAGVAAGGLDATAFRYVAGSTKPPLADGEWAFPDNPANPSGWNVTSQPFPQS